MRHTRHVFTTHKQEAPQSSHRYKDRNFVWCENIFADDIAGSMRSLCVTVHHYLGGRYIDTLRQLIPLSSFLFFFFFIYFSYSSNSAILYTSCFEVFSLGFYGFLYAGSLSFMIFFLR